MRKEWWLALGGVFVVSGCASKQGGTEVMTNEQLQAELLKQREEWQAIKPQLDRVLALEADLKLLVDSIELPPDETQVLAPASDSALAPESNEQVIAESPRIVPSAQLAQSAPVTPPESSASPQSGSQQTKLVSGASAAKTEPSTTDKPFQDTPPANAVVAQFYQAPGDEQNLYAVQLAAYASMNLAKAGWRKITEDNAEVFVGVAPRIKAVMVNNKKYYQLKVGPFLSNAYSNDFCNRLKQMQMDCLLSRYDGEPFTPL